MMIWTLVIQFWRSRQVYLTVILIKNYAVSFYQALDKRLVDRLALNV